MESREESCSVEKVMTNIDFGGMTWSDNYWIIQLSYMVNDIIEELMDLDMEPKPESL